MEVIVESRIPDYLTQDTTDCLCFRGVFEFRRFKIGLVMSMRKMFDPFALLATLVAAYFILSRSGFMVFLIFITMVLLVWVFLGGVYRYLISLLDNWEQL